MAWFALVPPGSRAPLVDFDDLADAFDDGMNKLLEAGQAGSPDKMLQHFKDGRQPVLTQLVAAHLLKAASGPANKMPAPVQVQPVMLAMIKAVVDETDRALRG